VNLLDFNKLERVFFVAVKRLSQALLRDAPKLTRYVWSPVAMSGG
jgi:hypothetical protein